jgi:hypothetical protein
VTAHSLKAIGMSYGGETRVWLEKPGAQ